LRDFGGEKRVVREQTNDIMKKPNMLRVLLTTVLMLALVAAPWSACGQAKPAAAPPEEHLKVEQGSIWVRQPGEAWVRSGDATVGNAVKALRGVYPEITFAVDPRVAAVPVTDLLIRANQPSTDLEALRTACGGRFDLGDSPIDPSGQQSSLYQLVYNNATVLDPSKKEDRDIECFSLNGYLDWRFKDQETKHEQQEQEAMKSINLLQSMIMQTISDFDGDIKMPHFQFYPEAQLLIVTGSDRAIEIASKVIHALPGEERLFGNGYDGGKFRGQIGTLQDPLKSQGMKPDSALGATTSKGGVRPPAAETNPNASYSPVPTSKN
jgi:hypothetical protein